MNSPLAALLKFEVLHGVGDVYVVTMNPRRPERAIEQPSGGSDKRAALLVFFISRLFPNQNYSRLAGAFSQHRLGSMLVQIAAPASLRRFAKLRQGCALRNERGSANRLCHTSSRTLSVRMVSMIL